MGLTYHVLAVRSATAGGSLLDIARFSGLAVGAFRFFSIAQQIIAGFHCD